MRITIITGPYMPIPPAACGAVEIRWHSVAQEFARRGHQVTFISRSWPGQARDETIDGVHYIRRSGYVRTNKLQWDLFKAFFYAWRILFLIPRCDICVTNTFWLPTFLSWLRPGVGKIVVNVARFPKKQMWLYLRCARLVCPSQAVADAVVDQTPSAEPITRVVPNPVNSNVFVPPATPRRWDGQRAIVFTGRIHPEKGIGILIDAFRQLPNRPADLSLKIVGPSDRSLGGGGEDYLRELKHKAQGLPVEFHPAIYDRAELARVLQDAHYYCYPTQADLGEAAPVAPLEAMAVGLPVILSDLDCFRNLVHSGENGVTFNYRQNPVTNLTAVLAEMIADPARAARLGTAAAETAGRYSYAAIADLYLADFQSLLEIASATGELREAACNLEPSHRV